MSLPNIQMSVVIATPDNYQSIRKTISCLRAQTVKKQLEIVIIAPSRKQLHLDESQLQEFGQFQVVEVGHISSAAFAKHTGLRHANATIVAFTENHVYPNAEWAQSLIAAYQQPWAAIGPAMVNANPKSAISWALFMNAYGRWMAPITSGVIDDLPGNNSSYKRAILLEFGEELQTLLETETILHTQLQRRGYQLYLEAAAQTQHLNPTKLLSCFQEMFYYGQMFAAGRRQNWSMPQTLLYTLGSPLIPFVRLRRALTNMQRVKQHHTLPQFTLIAIFFTLIASSLGEMIGYAFGTGKSKEKIRDFEYYREHHLQSY